MLNNWMHSPFLSFKLKCYYFRAVLGLQQHWGEGTENSHISQPQCMHLLPRDPHSLQRGTFVIHNESTPMHHNYSMSIVYNAVHSWCSHAIGIIQSIFIVPKIPCAAPLRPSPGPTPGATDLHSFSFARMSCNWNYIVYSFSEWLFSLSDMHLRLLHILSWFNSLFLFSTE